MCKQHKKKKESLTILQQSAIIKKKMKMIGSVELPSEAFLEVLKIDED